MRDNHLTEKEKKLFQKLAREENPPRQLEKKIITRLKEEGQIKSSGTMPIYLRWVAAVAAALLFFISGMYYEKSTQPPMTAIDASKGYILILHEDERFQSGEPMEMFEEYRQWMENTMKRGVKISGQELKEEAVLVSRSEVEEQSDARERTTGYFVLEADSLEEAVQVARDNPHIKYGGTIEVKPYMVR